MIARFVFLVCLVVCAAVRAQAPDGAALCSEQAQAAAEFRGALWLGGFQGGVCVQRDGQFTSVASPMRFINDMLVVNDALFVAAHEGLFVSHDGVLFTRVAQMEARGANGLASDGKHLWVTTPSVLFQLPLTSQGRYRRINQPGGSVAIQALARHGKTLWLATEDRGLVRVDGTVVTVFDALRGLGSSWVVDVEVDRQGNAYAATLRHGLYRVSRTGDVAAVPVGHDWLLRLYRDRNALLIGTQDGLVERASDGSLHELVALPDPRVHMLHRNERGLWVGTERGVALLTAAVR